MPATTLALHRFDVHPGVAMVQKWVAELPAKTGRTIEQWAELVRKLKLPTAKEKRAHMKAEYGLGTIAAGWMVEYTDGQATWDADPDVYLRNANDYVSAMYAGAKAGLFPIFEKLIEAGRALGSDVQVCPCKTMVPLYRSRVFAEIKPTTRTRVDLSLALGEVPESGVLKVNEQRVKKGDRLTHIIALESPKDVTGEVKKWLKAAYKQDAA
jgi:Domain of unknown function (DUF5655)/Domain of unknown function (DUF4287)